MAGVYQGTSGHILFRITSHLQCDSDLGWFFWGFYDICVFYCVSWLYLWFFKWYTQYSQTVCRVLSTFSGSCGVSIHIQIMWDGIPKMKLYYKKVVCKYTRLRLLHRQWWLYFFNGPLLPQLAMPHANVSQKRLASSHMRGSLTLRSVNPFALMCLWAWFLRI